MPGPHPRAHAAAPARPRPRPHRHSLRRRPARRHRRSLGAAGDRARVRFAARLLLPAEVRRAARTRSGRAPSTRCRCRRPTSGANSISSARSPTSIMPRLVRQQRRADPHLERSLRHRRRAAVDRHGADEGGLVRRARPSRFTPATPATPRSPARAPGRYGPRAFRQLPAELRERYFDHDARRRRMGGRARRFTIACRRGAASTSCSRASSRALQGADVVFCRNLFIYFRQASVRQVVERLGGLMPSPGFLCVGAAESLLRLSTPFDLQDIGGATSTSNNDRKRS